MGFTLLAVMMGGAACTSATSQSGPGIVQPGAPGEGTRSLEGEDVSGVGQHPYTEADVAFMQGMIAHHAQALVMTNLVPESTDNETIHLLARRIDISQEDEIILMERWLESRGEEVPDPEMVAHHAAGHGALMPGMLTGAQLAELEAARGNAFDRLFLQYMIQHHVGALDMVRELFASEAGGHETEIWQFASHVDADQRVEIDRMSRLLESMQ